MKKFTVYSVLIFLMMFGVIGGFSYAMYHRIATGYIEARIENTLTVTSTNNENIVASKIDYNYSLIKDFLDSSTDKSIEALNQSVTSLNIKGLDDIKFGTLSSNGLITKDINYNFVYGYSQQDILNSKVFTLRFSEAFSNEEAKEDSSYKMVFKYDDGFCAYFTADNFFNDIFSVVQNEFDAKYFIITSDGVIYYQTTPFKSNYFFQDYIRTGSVESDVTNFINDIKTNVTSSTSLLNCLNEESYICYQPLDTKTEEGRFYFITVFYKNSLVSFSNSLTLPLTVTFLVFCLVIIVGTLLIYFLLVRKNDDIESSKLSLYFKKPYVMHVRRNGKIANINSSFRKLNINWKEHKTIYNFSSPGEGIDILGTIKKSPSLYLQVEDKDGNEITFFMISIVTRNKRYLIGDDVTKVYNNYNELNRLSTFDSLTGLPNKIVLLRDLDEELNKILHEFKAGNVVKSSVVVFDIDGLQRFTKIFGNLMSDKIVKVFTEYFVNQESKTQSFYRISQDMFAYLFRDMNHYEEVLTWINSCKEYFKKPITIDENQLNVRIEFGIFNIDPTLYDNLTPEIVYENAEIAFNHARSLRSIDTFVYNLSLGRLVKREQLMEEDLKRAIENDEFVVYVQPQFNTNLQRIVGFEALTRWNNPKYKNDSPQHFIELAEKNNMIIPIGRSITEKAFKIAKKIEQYDITVSVNVSPAQLLQDGFVNQFIGIAEENGVKPELIAVEVTETFLVENMTVLVEKLNLLRRKGFKVHLDDFGTGYSSMLYLKNMPIDAIKIDKEFIKYINTDKYSKAIVSKLIALGKTLNLEVIAEGVEDEKQSLFLNKNNCPIIQGYLISKPVPFDDALKLISKYNGKGKKVKKDDIVESILEEEKIENILNDTTADITPEEEINEETKEISKEETKEIKKKKEKKLKTSEEVKEEETK